MQKSKYWHKLDNAAKVFPAVSKKQRSNVFRIAFYLNDKVNSDVLSEAVNITLKRFQVFNIQIKNGIFWNYFSENKNTYKVEQEPDEVCKFFKFDNNQGFLFKVYYYENKISLETFHSLTDGTGALEFLKSIVYEYLILMGNKIDHENYILSRKSFSNKENEDSFNVNYDPKVKKKLKEDRAYHLTGDVFKNYWTLVFKIKTNKDEVLQMVKTKYDATVTQYVAALIAYSIYDEGVSVKQSKKPIKMFIPVNLRPYFDSVTLRNFSLYIKASFDPRKKWTFEEMLELTKVDFLEQLNYLDLKMRLGTLVSLEKNVFVRFVPLFIKNIFFKIGFQMLGESINTSSLSNLGIVRLPNQMKEFVKDVDFINSGPGINSTIITYQDNLNISINTIIKDLSVIKSITDQLILDGINITVDTNYEEGYDEIL